MHYERILALIALLLLGASCKQYEDMPQGERYPSTLIAKQTDELVDLLRSSEKGWLLTLIPDGGTYGGRALVLKFQEGNSVKIVSEDQIYPGTAEPIDPAKPELGTRTPKVAWEVSSSYHISLSGGLRITFDSYNDVLHKYADPNWGLPESYNGDTDFIIERISTDKRTITLRGGRSGAIQTLQRLEVDGNAYVEAVDAMRHTLQGKALAPLTLGGKQVAVSIFGFARKLWVRYDDKQELLPIVFTDRGLKLLRPLTLGGETLSELLLSEDKTAMQTPDGKQSLELYSGYYDLTRGFINTTFKDDAAETSPKAYRSFSQMLQIQNNTYYPGHAGTFPEAVYFGRLTTDMPSISMQIDLLPAHKDWDHYYLDYTAIYGEPRQFHMTRVIQQGLPWFYLHDALDAFLTDLMNYSPYFFSEEVAGDDHIYIQSVASPNEFKVKSTIPSSNTEVEE